MTFEEIHAKQAVYSAVDPQRQRILYDLVKHTESFPEPMVEVGVFRGGSALTIALSSPGRILYACDTFEGLPEPDKAIDLHSQGDFSDTSFEDVKKYLDFPNVVVIKGLFPDPVIHERLYKYKFSFVHIDVDLYRPTLDCLKFFYDRLVPGGILVSDDYKWHKCPGVEKSIHEFLEGKPERVIDTGSLSCYFIKV